MPFKKYNSYTIACILNFIDKKGIYQFIYNNF